MLGISEWEGLTRWTHHNGSSAGRSDFHLRNGPSAVRAGVSGRVAAAGRPFRDVRGPLARALAARGGRTGGADRVLSSHAHGNAIVPAGQRAGALSEPARTSVRIRS